jgi:hypothetical protein
MTQPVCIHVYILTKLDFSISYKESGFKIITINWNIAISCIYEWIKCCPKRNKILMNDIIIRVCFKNTALKYPGCWPSIFDGSSLTTVVLDHIRNLLGRFIIWHALTNAEGYVLWRNRDRSMSVVANENNDVTLCHLEKRVVNKYGSVCH